MLDGRDRSALWRERSPIALVGFLQSLWEKPIWDGVWPYLDPMDSVCLRTAPTEWNVPAKYGPHGELFFFLIQKELSTMPGCETFSPFFKADILWEGPYWEGVCPCLDPWDVVRLRTSSSSWNVLVKCGPHSELFFFSVRKEPVALTKAVPFKPFVSAQTLKACALIGLHLLAAEDEAGSIGGQFP